VKIDFTLPAVDLPGDLRDRIGDSEAVIVQQCASSDELAKVAARWGRFLQPLGTLALGSLLVIIAMLVLGGDDPARWYVIGAAAALMVGFGGCLVLFRQSMKRTFHRLVRERLEAR